MELVLPQYQPPLRLADSGSLRRQSGATTKTERIEEEKFTSWFKFGE